ncbi:hypothetical protein [Cryptosporangium japonicum]|uniref:SnoaL-like domain-containing protein n=1 Tax=Cryptosporangium japonicum TaxID=80872 RepID=A0ABN0UDX6_9ACTN
MSSAAQFLADRYAAVWNEPDADRRRARIAELWAPDGVHVLQPPEELRKAAAELGFDRSTLEARGAESLEFRIRRAYDSFVAPGAYRFRARPDAERLADVVKFHWEMVGHDDGEVAAVGCEVLVLDRDGRIARDYQFIE